MGSGVYPRGCGGAIAEVVDCDDPTGLSPRVRGSLPAIVGPAPPPGSIPAGAGEPAPFALALHLCGVYPRGCGGAAVASPTVAEPWGLSPRVRGSRGRAADRGRALGSIPAGAGEPNRRRHQPRRYRVYPRGCGGASLFSGDPATRWGLSPRVRGSPMRCDVVVRRHGSIPAGAGEPGPTRFQAHQIGVYPRGCGGAPARPARRARSSGLSPRVRGSRGHVSPRLGMLGSIPAGAGEPCANKWTSRNLWVYPRGCGGAIKSA